MENHIIQTAKYLLKLTRFIFSVFCVLVTNIALSQIVWAQQGPICPETHSEASYPAYADVGNLPNIGIWKELPPLPPECHVLTESSSLLSVAIAARFSHEGTVEDIAARFGAVSKTQGLKYWSATDNNWRELVKSATALQSANKRSARDDFTAKEILSKQTHYFAQDDTRSWGLNVFAMNTITASVDRLTVLSQNSKPVRLGPLKLFDSGDLQTVVFISRADDNTWRYYSLAVVKDSALPAPEKSLVNRQAALYRYLTGQQPDKEPPLAP